ncbi:MAG: chromate transporter [Rhodoferax sp.]|nr:chromate transporter [Rhodoferax sp.]
MPPSVASTADCRPTSLSDLFWSFSLLALQGFGGVLAVVQRELVEKKRWLTLDEFVEDWSVAQVLPGPNVVNLSLMIGGRHFGWRGALVALAGMLAFPLLIVLALAVLFAGIADHPMAQGALRGLAAVAAGLIAATGLKMLPALRRNAMGRIACAIVGLACLLAVGHFRVPLLWMLLGLGVPAWAWAWYRLGRP